MKTVVHLLGTSQPITYDGAENCYTKGGMYCVLTLGSDKARLVHKYPLCNIFRVIESYKQSAWTGPDLAQVPDE